MSPSAIARRLSRSWKIFLTLVVGVALLPTGSVVAGGGIVYAASPDRIVMAVADLPVGTGDGAQVRVLILPSGDESADYLSHDWPVPSKYVSRDGDVVTVALGPDDIPDDYIDPGGHVTFEIAYTNEGQGSFGSSFETVRALVVNGQGHWMEGGTPLPPGLSNPRSRRPAFSRADLAVVVGRSRVSGPSSTDSKPPAQLKIESNRLEADSGNAGSTVYVPGGGAMSVQSAAYATPADHSNNFCEWTDDRTRVWATVGTSYPRARAGSTSRLRYSSSTSSRFGIAKNVGDGWVSTSDSRATTDNWGQQFSFRSEDRSYRIQVRYRKRKCSSMTFSGWKHTYYWIPRRQTGGNDWHELGSKPNWRTHCVPISEGSWWRGEVRGSDYQLSYGVKFKNKLGVELKSQRQYSSGGRLVYRNSTAKRGLCGNNDDPAWASKMMERSRTWIVNNGFG